jgi:hypothetical protein
MTSPFLVAIAAIFAAFAGYELWLNLHLRAVNDTVIEACAKPAIVEPVPQEFVLTAEQVRRGMSRGVMVR